MIHRHAVTEDPTGQTAVDRVRLTLWNVYQKYGVRFTLYYITIKFFFLRLTHFY